MIKPRFVRPSPLRRVLWLVRDAVFLAADGIALALLPKPDGAAPGKVKLAIVAAHGLGDLVLLLPAFEALRRLYPGATHRVTLICSVAAEEFARGYLNTDEIVTVDRVRLRRNLLYRVKLMQRLARAEFSVAIQPNFNRQLLIEDALIRATGAAERIGSSGTRLFMKGIARAVGDRWYTRLIPAAAGTMHDLERNAEFLRAFGGNVETLYPHLVAPPRDPGAFREPYALFAVGSSSPLKSWPLHNFEMIAYALVARRNLKILFCAGLRDGVARGDFSAWDETRFIDRLEQTDLAELVTLIAHAALLVSNDSAAIHLAAALRVPSVAVAGGGIVGRYLPYPEREKGCKADPVAVMVSEPMPCFDCGWACKFKVAIGDPAPCIAAIDQAPVLEAALERLSA